MHQAFRFQQMIPLLALPLPWLSLSSTNFVIRTFSFWFIFFFFLYIFLSLSKRKRSKYCVSAYDWHYFRNASNLLGTSLKDSLQIIHLLYTVAMIPIHGNSWPELIRADKNRSTRLINSIESINSAPHSMGNVLTKSFFVEFFRSFYFFFFVLFVLLVFGCFVSNPKPDGKYAFDFVLSSSIWWLRLWLFEKKQKKSHTLKFRLRVHVTRKTHTIVKLCSTFPSD